MSFRKSSHLLAKVVWSNHKSSLWFRRYISHLVKPITVRTCVGIYPKLREEQPKVYRNAPVEGVDLTVDYVDTWKDSRQKPEKTILAVHGTADTYATFTKLIEHFENSEVRVVVPNLPVFQDTRNTKGAFWHTTIERGYFLRDLLLQLNIDTVDCLVSHSIGVHAASYLLDLPEDIRVNSMALLAPQPLWFFPLKKSDIKLAQRMYTFPLSKLWSKFMELCNLHKHPKVPFKFTNMDQFLLMNTFIYDLNCPADLEQRLHRWALSNRPSILLYGSNEVLIPKPAIAKLKEILGIRQEEEICIDPSKDGLEKMKTPFGNKGTGYTFVNAGHFPHAKCAPFFNRLVEDLLQLPPH